MWQQVSGLGGGGGTDSHTKLPAQRSVTRCHWPYLQRHKKSETHQEKEKPHEFRNIFAPDETSSLQINKTFILCNLKSLPPTFPINFVAPVLVKKLSNVTHEGTCRAEHHPPVMLWWQACPTSHDRWWHQQSNRSGHKSRFSFHTISDKDTYQAEVHIKSQLRSRNDPCLIELPGSVGRPNL